MAAEGGTSGAVPPGRGAWLLITTETYGSSRTSSALGTCGSTDSFNVEPRWTFRPDTAIACNGWDEPIDPGAVAGVAHKPIIGVSASRTRCRDGGALIETNFTNRTWKTCGCEWVRRVRRCSTWKRNPTGAVVPGFTIDSYWTFTVLSLSEATGCGYQKSIRSYMKHNERGLRVC
jgi:hypothetical protein